MITTLTTYRMRRLVALALTATLAVIALAALSSALITGTAFADDPTPTPGLTPAPTPSDDDPVSPTDPTPTPTPTATETTATGDPTDEPTPPPPTDSGTPTVMPTTVAPTPTATPTPTPTPTASPTSTPVVLPPVPPAAATTSVPIADIVISLVVLVLTGLLLWGLTRGTVNGPVEGVRDVRPPERPADEDDVLALLAEAGEAMVDAGFDVNDVQSELQKIALAHGLPDAEIVAMPTVLVVSTRSGSGLRTGAVTTGHERLLLYQIEALDEIVTQSQHGLDPREALLRIAAVRAAPPPFGPGWQLLGGVLSGLALAVLLDSSRPGLLIAGLLGALVGTILLVGQRLPARYQPILAIVAASAVSLTVFLLAQLGLNDDVVPTLIAPLIMLLPGALLTTAVIELATGQMISGAGRTAAGTMQLLLLALGIVGPALLVGVPALDLTPGSPPLGAVGPWLAVGVFGIGIVLSRCARPRSLGWILIVLYVAYGAQVLGSVLVGPVLSAFVGALAMSPVADLVARQRGGPPAIVCFTPAFWILVPGALGLMGLATLLSGDGAGRDTVATTVITMVAIALGVLVGRAVSTMIGLRRDSIR